MMNEELEMLVWLRIEGEIWLAGDVVVEAF